MNRMYLVGGRTLVVSPVRSGNISPTNILVDDSVSVELQQAQVLYKLRKAQQILKKIEDVIVQDQSMHAMDNAMVIQEPSVTFQIPANRRSSRSSASVIDLGIVLDDLLAKLA